MDQNRAKIRSTIYIVAGAYLAYLAVSLGKGLANSTSGSHIMELVFTVVFGIAAVIMVIYGMINFQKSSQMTDENEGIFQDEESPNAQEVVEQDIETSDRLQTARQNDESDPIDTDSQDASGK